ncbi:hypothetical protein BYT27DRAFT_7235654 [Phlegmacium glaucopus]|nr:hypothetical protein BYT27DRAFT_7235654 [Phlegmacium glaucopus]
MSPSSTSPSSSCSSSSSRRVHPASQVDPSTHSELLTDLLELDISREVIEYVVDSVVETVDFAMGRKPAPPSSRGKNATRRPEHTKFITFVTNVLTRAEVTTPTLLAALVYIDRAKPHLHIGLEQWALERVFLGSIIVASKYLNDSTLKNVHWALCTGVFGKRDVGRIEREYLEVLNFELGVSESDLLSHHQGLLDAIMYLPPPSPRFTHHHSTRSHSTKSHHLKVPGVPALDPSSPSSSHSSSSSSSPSSPQTPSTMDSSPPTPDRKGQLQPSIPMKKPASSRKLITAAQFHASTMDLLRSFPIPRLTTS